MGDGLFQFIQNGVPIYVTVGLLKNFCGIIEWSPTTALARCKQHHAADILASCRLFQQSHCPQYLSTSLPSPINTL